MASLVSERGYVATRVTDVLRETGVSSRTFYSHFDNREACFFAAYEAIVSDLEALLDIGPNDRDEAGLGRVLHHFAIWPAHARVLLIEVLSAGPRGSRRHEQTMAMLAARLVACPGWQPGPCDSLERQEVAQAVIGAIVRIVQRRLAAGQARTLPELLPSLTMLTTRVGLAA